MEQPILLQDAIRLCLFFIFCVVILHFLIQLLVYKGDGWRYEHRPYLSRRQINRLRNSHKCWRRVKNQKINYIKKGE